MYLFTIYLSSRHCLSFISQYIALKTIELNEKTFWNYVIRVFWVKTWNPELMNTPTEIKDCINQPVYVVWHKFLSVKSSNS